MCCQLKATKLEAISWIVVRTKLTVLATVDVRLTSLPMQFVTLSVHLRMRTMRERQLVARVHLR